MSSFISSTFKSLISFFTPPAPSPFNTAVSGPGSPGGGGTYVSNGLLKVGLSYDSYSEVDLGYPYPIENNPIVVTLYDLNPVTALQGVTINFQILGDVVSGVHFNAEPVDPINAASFTFNPLTNIGSIKVPFTYTSARFNYNPLFEYAQTANKTITVKILPDSGYVIDPVFESRNIFIIDYTYSKNVLHLPFSFETQFDDVATNKVVTNFGATITSEIPDPFGNTNVGVLKLDGTNWVEIPKSSDFDLNNDNESNFNRESHLGFWYYPTSFPNQDVDLFDNTWGLLDTRITNAGLFPSGIGGWNLSLENGTGKILWSEGADNAPYTLGPISKSLNLNQWNYIRIYRDWSITSVYINDKSPITRINPPEPLNNTGNLLIGRGASLNNYKGPSASGYISDLVITTGFKNKFVPSSKEPYFNYRPPVFRTISAIFSKVSLSSQTYNIFNFKFNLFKNNILNFNYLPAIIFLLTFRSYNYSPVTIIKNIRSFVYSKYLYLNTTKLQTLFKAFVIYTKIQITSKYTSKLIEVLAKSSTKFIYTNIFNSLTRIFSYSKFDYKVLFLVTKYINTAYLKDLNLLTKFTRNLIVTRINITNYNPLILISKSFNYYLFINSYQNVFKSNVIYNTLNIIRPFTLNPVLQTFTYINSVIFKTRFNTKVILTVSNIFNYSTFKLVVNNFFTTKFIYIDLIRNFLSSKYFNFVNINSTFNLTRFLSLYKVNIKLSSSFKFISLIINNLRPKYAAFNILLQVYLRSLYSNLLISIKRLLTYYIRYISDRKYLFSNPIPYVNVTQNVSSDLLNSGFQVDTKDIICNNITFIEEANDVSLSCLRDFTLYSKSTRLNLVSDNFQLTYNQLITLPTYQVDNNYWELIILYSQEKYNILN